jgi:hypothetical protein
MLNESYEAGFTSALKDHQIKVASDEAAAIVTGLAMIGGALSGHASHVQKKLEHARHGKEYRPGSFIEKHPKTIGALSLGLAPAYSALSTRRELDRENPKVRKVMKDHPVMTFGR